MAATALRSQDWLPSSWLYASFGLKQFWARLNGADRLVAVLAALLLAALLIGFIIRLSHTVAIQSPSWTGLAVGVSVCALVTLTLTGTMHWLRAHKYFSFLPETNKRQQSRILLEWLASCGISLLICSLIVLFLPRTVQMAAIFRAIATVVVGHTLVHVIQLWMQYLPGSLTNSSAVRGIARRNMFAPFLASAAMKWLPHSSSRFMRRVTANLLVWALVMVAILAFGGAAISFKSPLLGISTLSSVFMMVQLALIEPRVGNGPAIGAHSETLPIRRAFNDLVAMTFPHLVCMLLAIPLLVIDEKFNNVIVAISQLVITIWITWLFLVIGALPHDKPSNIWHFTIAITASLTFPPLIPVMLAIGTIMLTRDLMRMSQQGPALWPR
jgi:hypothetical protein